MFNWRNAAFLLVAILTVYADQASKIWIRNNLLEGQVLFQAGFFRIVHVNNSGAAFGLFQGYSSILMVIAVIGFVAVLVVALVAHRHVPFLDTLWGKAVLGLTLGGIVGNLIDRIVSGRVTDFIDLTYWPIFNVADSALTVSIIIFVIYFLGQAISEYRQDERKA